MNEESPPAEPNPTTQPELAKSESYCTDSEEDRDYSGRFELEGRYIDLLERRIAALESRRTLNNDAESLRSIRPKLGRYPFPAGSRRYRRRVEMPIQKSKYARILFTREKRERGRTVSKENDRETEARIASRSRDLPSKLLTDEKKPIDAKHAFELHEIVNSRGEEIDLDIIIIDTKLKKLIASQLNDYPGHWDQEQMVFGADYDGIVHNWDRFETLLEGASIPDVTTRDDLRLLLEMIQKTNPLKTYFENFEMAKKDCTVRFSDLWILFPPGELVFGSPSDEPQVFIALSVVYRPRNEKGDPDDEICSLNCWRYGLLHFLKPIQLAFTKSNRF
jgi:hypothetical protein